MKNNKLLFSIFLVVFIDLLGFSLILPLLPYYASSFGADSSVIGLLVASYAAAQLFSSPILGRLSDRIGRRPVLLISIAGNVLGFILLALAQSLWMLFLARIVAGFTGGNISVAQAYIADVTDEKNRSRGLGLIGAAFGLGFIIGPAVGGILSQWGYALPAFVAAALSFVNLILVLAWLPESLTAERKALLAVKEKTPFTFKALTGALRRPLVGPLLHTRFIFGLAFSGFQAIFTLYALQRFNLGSTQTGYILAYVGLLSTITQGGLIRILTARFNDRQLLLGSAAAMAVGLLGWAAVNTVWLLLIDLIPIAVAGGVLNTVINSAISKSVEPVEVGGTLGLASSLESLTRVISPSAAGFLLAKVGTGAPGILAGALMVWLVTYIWRYVGRDAFSTPQNATWSVETGAK